MEDIKKTDPFSFGLDNKGKGISHHLSITAVLWLV